jgi:hypothetical protein
MTFRPLIIIAILPVLHACDSSTVYLEKIKSEQKHIDSLWNIEISDSLKSTSPYYILSFCSTHSGKTTRLDNLKIENWPEDILSFHDILYAKDGQPIAAQDAVFGHAESCLSRHYFDGKRQTISRLIDNWYYNDSLESSVDDKKIEFYSANLRMLEIDSVLLDEKGNTILGQVSKPRLDGKVLPSYKTLDEFIASNKIEL